MLAFLIVAFAIGAVAAATTSVRRFAVGILALELVGLAEALRTGIPFGEALLDGAGLFVSAQFGYVAGIGESAWIATRINRFEEPEGANRVSNGGNFDPPNSNGSNQGHDPIVH